MSARSLLTVITITKDDPVGFRRTLDSLQPLRALGVQHVVIDGGEEDFSLVPGEVLRIAREPRGIADAFNAGCAAANSDWIWFLNGGDALHEALDPARLLAYLSQTRGDAIFGAIQRDGDPQPMAMPHLRYQWPIVVCWPLHPAAIVRRETVVRVGGFRNDLRIAMDYDLWFRLMDRIGRVDVVSVCLARFDTKGISERESMRRLAQLEAARVLLRHSPSVLKNVCFVAVRAIWKLLGALVTLARLR